MKYIWHVALGSGGASKEPCSYNDTQLEAWRGHISAALETTDGQPIPGQFGYAMTAKQIGSLLLCTIGRAGDKTPLATFCVVEKSKHARKAWEALHQGYPQFAASLHNVPQAPYCAVRAEVGLIYDQAAAAWIDAYQLAIAWAWISDRHRHG